MTLNVPSVKVVCSCDDCDGSSETETVSQKFLKQYPKIKQAYDRYRAEEERDFWGRPLKDFDI